MLGQPEAARVRRLAKDEQRGKRLQRLFAIAVAGLAALVPLILFAGFWIRSELGKSQRDIESYLSVRAASLSRRIDAELERQLAAMRALSALPAFDGGSADLADTVERIKTVMPQWAGFGIVEAGGGRSGAVSRPGWPDTRALAVVREVAASRKPRIESPGALGIEGAGIFLYVPVVRNDRAQLVLMGELDPTELQRITLDPSAADLSFTVTDGTSRILARSRQPREGGEADPGEIGRQAAGKTTGLFQTISGEGEPASSAFAKSPLTGWISVVSMEDRHVDRLSNRSVWATIAAGALSLILAGILAVFVVHTVVQRRVSDERLAASRALGELDARLLATSQEALGEQRKASSEREVLLREIYHRVKNNLQIVQSLLRLGSRDLSPEQREPFESAVRRIGAMARVHTLLYNSPDLASIDFKDYLGELLKELSDGFGAEERSIQSVLNANSMRIPLDTAVPLAFIAVEILTNAYRHAFPHGRPGKISVEIGRDEPFGTLRIVDDGIGIVREATAKRRLGLTIVRKLVQQIGGTLEEPEPGSSAFLVRFPLEPEDASSGPERRAAASA